MNIYNANIYIELFRNLLNQKQSVVRLTEGFVMEFSFAVCLTYEIGALSERSCSI